MTIDKQKLKALAEDMPELDWDSQFEDHEQTGFCTVYGKPFEIDGQEHEGPTYVERCTAGQAEFIAGAKEAVMALLAEIDGVHAQHARDSAELRRLCQARDEARRERDQLKAENEALRKDAERYRWTAIEGNWLARMFGKWRAHTGEYGEEQPTAWYPSRGEAIDAAISHAKAMAKEASRD